jgi:long-chain fatty acid transport protein
MNTNTDPSNGCRSNRARLLAGAVLTGAAVLVPLCDASAGGFALRDQSTVGEGDAFAGVAAGGQLSSMFWNPATMTQIQGVGIETATTAIIPNANQQALPGSTLLPFGLGDANNMGSPALLPALYASRQISPNLWLGIAVNSPFGLATTFNDWTGRNYALSSSIHTYNAAPSVAWKVTDWLSVGVGAQVQFARADVHLGLGAPPPIGPGLGQIGLGGSGWGYGMTAGVTITPGPNTTVGIGWRSAIDQKIDGTLGVTPPGAPAGFGLSGAASTTVNLPDTVSVGLRHRFDDHWTFLATAEWSNWSRIGTSLVSQATIPSTVALPFQFKDGWFYSVGAEYVLNPKYTFRAGLGYEVSPVTDQVRMPILPDSDRVWLSAGMTYKMLPNLSMDLGYTHLFFREAPINISAGSGNPWFNPASPIAYTGNASTSVNIFSLGVRYQFGVPPASFPTKG